MSQEEKMGEAGTISPFSPTGKPRKPHVNIVFYSEEGELRQVEYELPETGVFDPAERLGGSYVRIDPKHEYFIYPQAVAPHTSYPVLVDPSRALPSGSVPVGAHGVLGGPVYVSYGKLQMQKPLQTGIVYYDRKSPVETGSPLVVDFAPSIPAKKIVGVSAGFGW